MKSFSKGGGVPNPQHSTPALEEAAAANAAAAAAAAANAERGKSAAKRTETSSSRASRSSSSCPSGRPKKLDKFGFITNLGDDGIVRALPDHELEDLVDGRSFRNDATPRDSVAPEETKRKKKKKRFLRSRSKKKRGSTASGVKSSLSSELSPAERNKLVDRRTRRRTKKWNSMMSSWSRTSGAKSNSRVVRRRVRKGVPDELRGTAWALLGNVPDRIEFERRGVYDRLVRESTTTAGEVAGGSERNGGGNGPGGGGAGATRETIERDINRTFPRHYMFYDLSDRDDSSDDDDDECSDSDDSGGGLNYVGPNGGGGDGGGQIPSWAADDSTAGGESDAETAGDASSAAAGGARNKCAPSSNFLDAIQCSGANLGSVVVERSRKKWNADASAAGENGGADELDKVDVDAHLYGGASDAETEASSSRRRRVAPAAAAVSSSSATSKSERKKGKKRGSSIDFATAKGGQAMLRRVLRAYSVYDPDVGYCQGMNFIAAMFITFMSEEEAFWLLVAVMNDPPCRMRGLFGEGMSGAHKVLHVAERLIQQFLPRLAQHLEQENVHITMFATQWLLTLYTSSFPFGLVARVWDCFLAEGWKIVYRVMLALLDRSVVDLMKLSFEDILAYFRELPEKVDGDVVLEAALKIPLRKKHIAKYENEWIARQPPS